MRKLTKAISALLAFVMLMGMMLSVPFTVSAAETEMNITADASMFNGHFYKVFKETVSWHEAKLICENLGGHLATVTSNQENNFIYGLVQNAGVQSWLGGTDEEIEGEWKWITGEDWTYYPDEYGFDNRNGNQDYLVIGYDNKNFWDDQSDKQGFLCQANGYTCEWESANNISDRKSSVLSNNRLTVYQNENSKYNASENAKIEYNGNEYYTNSFGIANLPSIDSGSITVSKNGYITRTLTAQQLKNSKSIYLEAKNDNAPVITAVWVDDTDVLHDSYPLDMTSKDATTIKAEVDWGNYSYESIKLYQDGKTAYFSGDSLSMVISDKFDTSNTITLIATDSQNHTAEKELLIQNEAVNNALEVLNGASFDFSDSISLTLPKDTPLIGGMKVGAGLLCIGNSF